MNQSCLRKNTVSEFMSVTNHLYIFLNNSCFKLDEIIEIQAMNKVYGVISMTVLIQYAYLGKEHGIP